MQEIWKRIDGFPNYSVSNLGKVMNNNTGKLIKPYNMNGYVQVTLRHCGNSVKRTVHRLVALSFILNPENKPQVNHIDGNRSNNRVDNLEWCTAHENNLHGYRVLDSKQRRLNQSIRQRGKKHSAIWKERIGKANSKKIVCIETGKVFDSMKDAIASVGRTSKSHICLVCQGKRKTAYGYHWKYYEEGETYARIG